MKSIKSWGIILLGISLLLAGCAQEATPLPTLTPLPSSTSTQTPTATQVWFPPTATNTPLPTIETTPTPDPKPGIGSVLISNLFDDEESWQTYETESSSIAIEDGSLTMVSSEISQYLTSYQSGEVLGDAYLEVDIRVNLCGEQDEFGLILRAQPDTDQYRLGMSCDGQIWVDRKYKGIIQTVVPKISYGLVPSTTPDTVTLGVWMKGSTIHFFLDGFYVFELNDTIFFSGGLGVYARSMEGSSISASFSGLAISELQP